MALRNFLCGDSGAVTVDWVVLSAAIVGLGVASVVAVRSGVGSLGNDIALALGDASEAMACQDGAYEARVLTGDRAREAESIRDQIAGMSDDEVRANYTETVEKAGILRAEGQPEDYVNEILDYAALYGAELTDRRLTDDRAAAAFAALTGTGGDACGANGGDGGDGGDGGGYTLMALADLDGGRFADNFREEISRYDSEQVLRLYGESETTYYEALAAGDDEKARIMLDQMYLARQELGRRDDMDRHMPAIDDHFQHAVDAYQPPRR